MISNEFRIIVSNRERMCSSSTTNPSFDLIWGTDILGAPITSMSVRLQRIDASAKHTRRDGPNVAPVPVSVSKEKWSLLRV
jgi:hypothetical protein